MDEPSPDETPPRYAETEEDRRRIILRARRKLPRLDREYEALSKDAYRRFGIPFHSNWSKD